MNKITGWLLFVCLFCCLSGCSKAEQEQIKSGYKIYYVNNEENNVVAQAYQVKSTKTDKLMKELIDELENGANSTEYKASKPQEVTLLEYNLNEEEHILSLKFDSAYKKMSNTAEILMRTAYVKTLVQIQGVDYVGFYVGEEPLADSNGDLIGVMNEESFIDNSAGQINGYAEADISLYFANEKGDRLKQGIKHVVYDQNIPLEKVVIEQLIKGPSAGKGLYPTVPSNTKLVSVSIKDGICYVNFDEEFIKLEYEVSEEVQVYSVVNSLAELSTVNKVQISINGMTDRTFVEKINFNTIFERNLDIIEEAKGD